MTSRPQSVSEAHGDSATETEDEDTAGASSSSQVVGDAEACRQLNQEELLSRVRYTKRTCSVNHLLFRYEYYYHI